VSPIETSHLCASLPGAVISAFTNTDLSNHRTHDANWYHLRTSWSFWKWNLKVSTKHCRGYTSV